MRRIVVVSLALLGSAPLAAGGPPEAPAVEPAVAAANSVNGFAADLMKQVASSGGNVFVSPHSIAVALAMARAGAAGETAKQIDAVFHLPPSAAAAFRELTTTLGKAPMATTVKPGGANEEVPAYALSIANGLFSMKGWPFKDSFRSTIGQDYAAEFREVDFKAGDEARAAINGWVEEKTKQRIKDIVPPGLPTADTRMVLANAIHFKAAWADPFKEGNTADKPFTVAPGKEVTAKTMARTGSLDYAETADAQILEIPYLGRATSMVVVLPKLKHGLDAIVKGLTPASLAQFTAGLAHKKVAVELPKFTFTTALDVSSTLRDLGIKDAFDASAADFTGITDQKPLFVGQVLHKAFVAVDEAGTEAAAATVVMMRAGSAMRTEEPVKFVVDHPFLFLIRHRATGVVLFAGRVVDPTAN